MALKKTSPPSTYPLLFRDIGGKVLTAVIGTIVTAIIGGFIGSVVSIGATNILAQQNKIAINALETKFEQHTIDNSNTNLILFNYLSNIGGKLGLPPIDSPNLGSR